MTEEDENGKVKYKNNRPMLMISSTSWTPDEDFNMLLESFIKIEKNLKIDNLRKVLFIITGRGPQKESFMKKVQDAQLKLFDVKSIWLESDDYPKLLGSGDLGVCLHYSSSGYDLPMKVVDMFSSGLPVCAVFYPTINELVKVDQNGFLFKDVNQLEFLLKKLITEFSESGYCRDIEKMRENLKAFNQKDWISQWNNTAKDAIIKAANLKTKEY
jgi:beta-1,4-mannosyltransferase